MDNAAYKSGQKLDYVNQTHLVLDKWQSGTTKKLLVTFQICRFYLNSYVKKMCK